MALVRGHRAEARQSIAARMHEWRCGPDGLAMQRRDAQFRLTGFESQSRPIIRASKRHASRIQPAMGFN
jgi:hypothetical protein